MNRFKTFENSPTNGDKFNRWLELVTLKLVKAAVLVALGYAWAMLAMGKGVMPPFG